MPTADSWGSGRFSSSTCRAETVPVCQELGEKSLLWCGQGEGQLSRNCISASFPESEAITRTFHRIPSKGQQVRKKPWTGDGQMERTGRLGKTLSTPFLDSPWRPKAIRDLLTQCFRSTSSSASHFRVKKGCFWLIISPSKKVVRVGYSYGQNPNIKNKMSNKSFNLYQVKLTSSSYFQKNDSTANQQ